MNLVKPALPSKRPVSSKLSNSRLHSASNQPPPVPSQPPPPVPQQPPPSLNGPPGNTSPRIGGFLHNSQFSPAINSDKPKPRGPPPSLPSGPPSIQRSQSVRAASRTSMEIDNTTAHKLKDSRSTSRVNEIGVRPPPPPRTTTLPRHTDMRPAPARPQHPPPPPPSARPPPPPSNHRPAIRPSIAQQRVPTPSSCPPPVPNHRSPAPVSTEFIIKEKSIYIQVFDWH